MKKIVCPVFGKANTISDWKRRANAIRHGL